MPNRRSGEEHRELIAEPTFTAEGVIEHDVDWFIRELVARGHEFHGDEIVEPIQHRREPLDHDLVVVGDSYSERRLRHVRLRTRRARCYSGVCRVRPWVAPTKWSMAKGTSRSPQLREQ